MQPAPITSPDGQFVWDGTEWQPNPDAPTPAAADTSTTSTTTAAPTPAPAPYGGPKVGSVVAHTFVDPYSSDTEVTRYGVIVAGVGADPSVAGSTDTAEVAWLPDGTAQLPVSELDEL